MKDALLVSFSGKQVLGQLGMWKGYGSIISVERKGRNQGWVEEAITPWGWLDKTSASPLGSTGFPYCLLMYLRTTALHSHCLRGWWPSPESGPTSTRANTWRLCANQAPDSHRVSPFLQSGLSQTFMLLPQCLCLFFSSCRLECLP